MANYSLIDNINQTIADFDDIQSAINEKSGDGTVLDTDATSTYADKIRAITTEANITVTNGAEETNKCVSGLSANGSVITVKKQTIKDPRIRYIHTSDYTLNTETNSGVMSQTKYNEIISNKDSIWLLEDSLSGSYKQVGVFVVNDMQIILDVGIIISENNISHTYWNVVGDSYAITITTSISYVPEPSITTPLMNGVASIGTLNKYAKADHIHPTDSKITALESNFTETGSARSAEALAINYVEAGGSDYILTAASDGTEPVNAGLIINPLNNHLTIALSDSLTPLYAPSPYPLTITINSGTTEGTDKFTYDGFAAKTVNISSGTVTFDDIVNAWNGKAAILTQSDTALVFGEAQNTFIGIIGQSGIINLEDSNEVNILSVEEANGLQINEGLIQLQRDGIGRFYKYVEAMQGFYQTSDERLKDFKDDIKIDFDKLAQIPTKYFTWKKDKENASLMLGTSAQEVQKLYPELVVEKENGELSVDYARLSIICLAAIKELKKEIEELKR